MPGRDFFSLEAVEFGERTRDAQHSRTTFGMIQFGIHSQKPILKMTQDTLKTRRSPLSPSIARLCSLLSGPPCSRNSFFPEIHISLYPDQPLCQCKSLQSSKALNMLLLAINSLRISWDTIIFSHLFQDTGQKKKKKKRWEIKGEKK